MSHRKSKSQLKHQAEQTGVLQAEFDSRKPEIEASLEKLSEHKLEFEAMLANPRGMLKRAAELFSSENFNDFRYTLEDVIRAVESTRCLEQAPALIDNPLELATIITIYLAGPETRGVMSRQLYLMLPGFLAERRYLDAWLVQSSAASLIDEPNDINLFLYEMVRGAIDAFTQTHSIPSEPGQATPDNPQQPSIFDQETAVMLEQQFINLLDICEEPELHLNNQMISSWLPAAVDRISSLPGPQDMGNPIPAEIYEHQVAVLLLETAAGIVSEVFTPKRENAYITGLQACYSRLIGEMRLQHANQVAAGLHILQQLEGSIFEIRLLTMVVFDGLRRALAAT